MVAFLSDEWFLQALEGVRDAGSYRCGANARLQYEAFSPKGSVHWGEVIEDGRVAAWEKGPLQDADVDIRWSVDDAYAILRGDRVGAAAAAATTIVEQRPDGFSVGVLPPCSLAKEPALARLRRLPGADLTLHCQFPAAPIGGERCSMMFVDGQLARMVAGWVGDADVVIEFPFRQLILFWRGEITWADALQEGAIRGSIEPMVFLAGIIESTPYRRAAARATSGPAPLALATVGELVANVEYRTAVTDLMARTSHAPEQ